MITFVLFNKRQSQIKSQIHSALHRKKSLPPHTLGKIFQSLTAFERPQNIGAVFNNYGLILIEGRFDEY